MYVIAISRSYHNGENVMANICYGKFKVFF